MYRRLAMPIAMFLLGGVIILSYLVLIPRLGAFVGVVVTLLLGLGVLGAAVEIGRDREEG